MEGGVEVLVNKKEKEKKKDNKREEVDEVSES